jgi:hypothetical protein
MRLSAPVESQVAQAAGLPVTTTVNGYICAIVAAAGTNFKLRRVKLGFRGPAGSVTSDQHTIAIYRQTVRPVGTGMTNVAGGNLDPRGLADPTSGIDFTTAASWGTSGPTLGANALDKLTVNTQTSWDVPWDYIEDLFCDQGTANGLAFVNIGNAFPASHLLVITPTWEV